MTTTDSARLKMRNVIIVGRSGSGKSTIANKIIESPEKYAPFPVSHTGLSSTTTKSSAVMAVLKTDRQNGNYLVKVIDTVGLHDKRAKKSNDAIMKEVKAFCKQTTPMGLNLILHVFNQRHWTDEERKSFDSFVGQFLGSEVSAISALVITGCDGYTDKEKENLIDDFKSMHDNLFTFMQKGIYTVSFQDVYKLRPQIREAHKSYQKADQESLRQLIYSCDEMKLSSEILQDSFWESINSSLCNIM